MNNKSSAQYVELEIRPETEQINESADGIPHATPISTLKTKITTYLSSKEFRFTFKSLIAFSIASLFSFVDPLSDIVYPGNRLVAVCAVLFNVGMR